MNTKTTGGAQQAAVARCASTATKCGELQAPSQQLAMLRKRQVLELTTWSNSTLYNRMRQGFPAAVRLGPRRVAWPATEVYAYLDARLNERDARVAAAGGKAH